MINEDLFQEFLAMRIEAKLVKVNTDRSVYLLRDKLQVWETVGYNTDTILKTAIEKQWRGLFIPNGMEPKQTHLKPAKNVQEVTRGLVAAKTIKSMSAAAKQARADVMRMTGAKILKVQK